MVKKQIFFFLNLLLLIAGCIQTVEVHSPEEREIVVKCILMNDEVPTVELFYSGAVGDTHFDPVEDAQVMISTRAGATYRCNHEKNGRYIGDFRPNPNQTYHLIVLVPGRDTISATTTIPEKFEMETAFFPPEEWLDDSDRLLEDLFIPELSTPDFPIYDWQEYNRIYPWSLGKKGVNEMRSTGGSSLMDLMPGMIFRLVDSWPRVMYIVGTREEGGRMVRVKQLATNHLLVDNANLGEYVYHSGDDAAIDTSLQVRFEHAIDSRYEGLSLHDNYLRLVSDGDYDNGLGMVYRLVNRGQVFDLFCDASPYFSVVGDFSYNYWGTNDERLRSSLYFCSVSEEYDLYLQDCQRQITAMKGDVLASLYSNATNNYTNIKGGFGIFGAMYVLRHDCDLTKKPGGVPPMYAISDYYEEYPPYPAPLPEL